MKKRGKIVIFSGPSGVGKDTVKKLFIDNKELNLKYSISATTRNIREGEIEGKSYYFLTKQKFEDLIKSGNFLEWAIFSDNFYGTPFFALERHLKNGENVLLEIEIKGVKQIIEKYPEAITIYLLPPSFDELKKRLVKRSTESISEINKRVEIAKEEIKNKKLFKYKVINYTPNDSANKIVEILKREFKK